MPTPHDGDFRVDGEIDPVRRLEYRRLRIAQPRGCAQTVRVPERQLSVVMPFEARQPAERDELRSSVILAVPLWSDQDVAWPSKQRVETRHGGQSDSREGQPALARPVSEHARIRLVHLL